MTIGTPPRGTPSKGEPAAKRKAPSSAPDVTTEALVALGAQPLGAPATLPDLSSPTRAVRQRPAPTFVSDDAGVMVKELAAYLHQQILRINERIDAKLLDITGVKQQAAASETGWSNAFAALK